MGGIKRAKNEFISIDGVFFALHNYNKQTVVESIIHLMYEMQLEMYAHQYSSINLIFST